MPTTNETVEIKCETTIENVVVRTVVLAGSRRVGMSPRRHRRHFGSRLREVGKSTVENFRGTNVLPTSQSLVATALGVTFIFGT